VDLVEFEEELERRENTGAHLHEAEKCAQAFALCLEISKRLLPNLIRKVVEKHASDRRSGWTMQYEMISSEYSSELKCVATAMSRASILSIDTFGKLLISAMISRTQSSCLSWQPSDRSGLVTQFWGTAQIECQQNLTSPHLFQDLLTNPFSIQEKHIL
jgi:hypothetical protein